MTDCNNNEVKVGDRVAYTLRQSTYMSLGKIIAAAGGVVVILTDAHRKISRGKHEIALLAQKEEY